MNILFFLTPKIDVTYLCEEDSVRQALEKMEYHRYSCIPIIREDGSYMGTIREGDLLWDIKNKAYPSLRETERIPITQIARRGDYDFVRANASMEDLIERALNQNFVPVVDDQSHFIGIVTRKDILKYFYSTRQ